MLRFSLRPVLGAAAVAVSAAVVGAQQSEVSISPFVTFLPTESARPMAGLSLTFAGGPLALRAGGQLSLRDRDTYTSNNNTTTGTTTTSLATPNALRPWQADADAIAYLEGYNYGNHVAFMPYVFTGVSTAAVDSGSRRFNRNGWSYGGGMTMPIGSALGVFGEMRWRMSRYVFPNATDAPAPTREFRFGFKFRVGGGGGDFADVVRVIQRAGEGEDVIYETSSQRNNYGAGNYGTLRVLSMADEYVGVPYRRGGQSPNGGFDASGFVRFVFSRLGVNLPRMSRDQARVGERVRADWGTISPGDLVMFDDGEGINHVAIYVGRRRIIHSSSTGGGVRYDDLESDRGRWFLDHLVAARRVTPDVRGLLLDLARGFSNEQGRNSDGPDRAPKATMKRRN